MRTLVQKHIDKHAVRDPALRDLPPMEVEPHFDKPACETSPVDSLDLSAVSAVVFATGYSLDFESMIDVPGLCDETGYPLQYRGVSSAMPGLYFLGLPWLHKWQSVTLLGAAEDAEYVATHIANNVSSSLAPSRPCADGRRAADALAPRPPPPPLRLRPRAASDRRDPVAGGGGGGGGDDGRGRSSDGAVGTMGKPQLYGADALARPFDTWRQLINDTSTADAIRACPDGRRRPRARSRTRGSPD